MIFGALTLIYNSMRLQSVPAVRQRLALPAMVLLMMLVHGNIYLLLHLHFLDDRNWHVLDYRHVHVLVNWHLLDNRYLLNYGHVHRVRHLRYVVVMDRADLVGDVDGHVFAGRE